MFKQKLTLTVIGITALVLLAGIVFANSYEFKNHKAHFSEFREKFNATPITGFHKFYKYWNTTNFTESLGLPANASYEEIRSAVRERMETEREGLLARVKEKLGLHEDATNEEIKEALKQWREENKDLMRASMHNKIFGQGFFRIHH